MSTHPPTHTYRALTQKDVRGRADVDCHDQLKVAQQRIIQRTSLNGVQAHETLSVPLAAGEHHSGERRRMSIISI